MIEYKPWPKTPRLFRDIVITEKIDGTNSAIIIVKAEGDLNLALENVPNGTVAVVVPGTPPDHEDSAVYFVGAQSRNRLITPGKTSDNYGFAGWVHANAEALVTYLGEGHHYGEWWGQGIARRYNMDRKVFSLFNTHRHAGIEYVSNGLLDVVPTLYIGPYSEQAVNDAVTRMRERGSAAAPGFMDAEGVCVFHSASRQVYKVLCKNDELPKGLVA